MSQTNPDEFVPLQTLDELMPVAAFKVSKYDMRLSSEHDWLTLPTL